MSSRPSWEIIASLWLHLSLGAVLVLGQKCSPSSAPLFQPEDVMRVQMASLPKSPITQRATRAPEPAAVEAPTPEPVVEPTPAPTTASDMVLHTEEDEPDPVKEPPKPEEKKPPKGKTDKPAAGTPTREELVNNTNAPEGTRNQSAGSPDGVDDAVGDIIGIGEADPVLAAWMTACKKAILPNWSPLPATVAAHPEYVVQILVSVAADGTLSNPRIYKGTGDRSFDRAAQMAVIKTRKLPPPPDDWKASASKGVLIELPAKDKL